MPCRRAPTLAGTVDSNRRLSARTALRAPASVALPGGQTREVRLWDLAHDGASLQSARPIPQGSSLELRFELPAPGGGTTAVTAAARVVYSSYIAPNEFKIGLAFTRLGDDAAAAIAAFMV
jgi:hypothetical protein